MVIRRAVFPEDRPAVLAIWREFIAGSPVSLDFQGNAADLAELPGKYAAPGGCVLLACQEDRVEGCVAFRRIDADVCEMKRLYVRPGARGGRLGHALVARLIAEARAACYREMRLDVLPQSGPARRLYAEFGFAPAAPVSFNPTPGTAFLGLQLEGRGTFPAQPPT